MAESVKISYNAAVTRVRCEFTRSLALTMEKPPEDVVKRAKAKMEAIKNTGEIAFYVVHEQRFLATWDALRAADHLAPDQVVGLTLAAGAPDLPGLLVEPSPTEKFLITIATAELTRTESWKWDWFKLWVHRRMLELGVKALPNNAQLYSAFTKAKAGSGMEAQPVGGLPPAPADGPGKAFSVVGNKQRKEIGVIIRNVDELRDKAQRDHMLQLINQAVRQLTTEGVEYRVLKKDFLAALQSALDGPEGLGIEVPLSLLAAVGSLKASGDAAAASPTDEPPPLPTVVGNAMVKFAIAHDHMAAVVAEFDKDLYDHPDLVIDLDWLKEQMTAFGITLPMSEDLEALIGESTRKLVDLSGQVVCRGREGKGGKAPFLHPTYKDATSRVKGDIENAQLDLRMMQQRSTVQAGQVVAEIRFREPAVAPRNVFNKELALPASEPLDVQVGEGILQRGLYEFIAQIDGIPAINGLSLSLSPALVHQGDVNLSTGDIFFDGPIEIHGNVETGARIESNHNLTVHGTITGARIQIKGDLKVDDGITTGSNGVINVRGSITAQFIEQATILCQGDVMVQKSIMNSHIYCSGTVVVAAGGVISGGKVVSLGSLQTGSLGTSRGSLTTVSVGIDWKVARSIDIKQKRAEKLKKRLNEDRLALRDLVQKKPGQMTAKHNELKDKLQGRLPRMRAVVESLEALIATAETSQTYNATSRIVVKETLFANVHVTVGGQIVPIAHDVMEVSVNPKRIRGSFICPLEEKKAS